MADFKENYKKNVGKTVLELFKKVLNVKKDYVNKQNQLSIDLQTGGAQPSSSLPAASGNSLPNIFLLNFKGGSSTHDLGEIPASYGLDGLFVADLGGTDLKFLGKNEKGQFAEQKYKNPKDKTSPTYYGKENGNYLLNEPEFKTLVGKLQNYNWPEGRKLYIRAGSIVKEDEGRGEKIKALINKFNGTSTKYKIELDYVTEDSVKDALGRLNKEGSYIVDKNKTIINSVSPGDIIILGGPLKYGLPIKEFSDENMRYTETDKATKAKTEVTATSGGKMPFKFYYYHQAYLALKNSGEDIFDASRDFLLMGPTGSNPTITVVNTDTNQMSVYEFETKNYDKTAENGGWSVVVVPEPKNIQINPRVHPNLFGLMVKEGNVMLTKVEQYYDGTIYEGFINGGSDLDIEFNIKNRTQTMSSTAQLAQSANPAEPTHSK